MPEVGVGQHLLWGGRKVGDMLQLPVAGTDCTGAALELGLESRQLELEDASTGADVVDVVDDVAAAASDFHTHSSHKGSSDQQVLLV